MAAATELAREGWLIDGGVYPCGGTTYRRFELGRLDLRELRGRW